ncbi:response regulator [Natronococcus pandeyae]|uniref:Response regulator n=1 Tax=Natronococcus pandeyae TaxID=2055836 RepID=A0A8J8Q3E3_9EURY|nr:response regulator [Natronococcus pandeyae]TYL36390.1 response regulator [Natronococcus pandeyae]
MLADQSEATVVVVDDEKEVADAYALRLQDRYNVVTVYGGEEALAVIDDDTDVVLLDRFMPDVSGDEVLRRVRERGTECYIVMVTAVDPELDILEMPFDDYLCKPVGSEDLVAAIDNQLRVLAFEKLSEFFRLESKRAVLSAAVPQDALVDHPDYQATEATAEALEADLRGLLADFDRVVEEFRAIKREQQ